MHQPDREIKVAPNIACYDELIGNEQYRLVASQAAR